MSLPCSVTDLIPQKGKMGFDQILTATNGDVGQSVATIQTDNWFLDERRQLSNIALVEYINQLVAAVQGYKEIANDSPAKKGLFVGLQEAEFWRPVHLGDTLTLQKTLLEEVPPVSFVQGIIERDGERIAALVTKIYEIKDFAELNFGSASEVVPAAQNSVVIKQAQPPAYLDFDLHRQLYAYIDELTSNADEINFKMAFPADFVAFDGHFPGKPILPGIILLEIAQMALEILLKQSLDLKTVKKMKINGMVLPDQVVSGTVKKKNSDCESGHFFTAVFQREQGREISRFSGTCAERRQ